MRKSNRAVNVLISGLLFWIVTATAAAQTVAMVTDLSGGVASGDGAAVEILSELNVGDRVQVTESAGITIVYLDSGRQFRFTGPAEFEVGTEGPNTISGGQPDSDSVLPEGEGSVSTVGLAQAGMVMRAGPNEPKLAMLFPVETVLLTAPHEFKWQELEKGVGYTFELTDPEGRSLVETTVTGTSLSLPEHVTLIPGEFYSWSLETRLPDGRKFSTWASFSVADEDLKAVVAAHRPGDEEDVSRLVLHALWLEQNELMTEAQKYWKMVSELRPEAARIKTRLDLGE